jgi:hypothetical protein
MEHSMRKLCLYLNDCPMRRGCKLDKILRPTMDNGTTIDTPHRTIVMTLRCLVLSCLVCAVGPNLFYTAWSRPMMHAFYDLFQWGECTQSRRLSLRSSPTQQA